MELLKQSSTSHLYDLIYKEQQKRQELTWFVINLILSLIGNAIGCIIVECYRDKGAKLTPTMIAISICWIICWIRYRNKIKKIK